MSADPVRPKRRRLVLLVGVPLLLVLVVAAALVSRPWLPLRYGRAVPPAPDLQGLEAPLAKRIKILTTAVRHDPYSAEAWGELGIVYEVHDMPEEAVACYRRARRLDPADFRWTYFLGLSMLPVDHRGALEVLLDANEIVGDYAPLHLYLGRGHFDIGAVDTAETHYRQAARLDPKLVRPHIGLAQVALARDDAEMALRHLGEAARRGPRGGEVHFELSEAYRRLGDMESARRHLAQAGERTTFEEFGDAVRTKWQWEAGVTVFWRNVRAQAYLQQGWVDRAIAEWQQVLRDDPDSVRAHVELGKIQRGAGRVEPAIASYERALRLDADLHAARHNLGHLLLRRGRIEEGLDHLRRSCAGLPENPDVHGNLARALEKLGRREEALRMTIRAAELLVKAERTRDAIAAYEHALMLIEAGPSPEVDLRRAVEGQLAQLQSSATGEPARGPGAGEDADRNGAESP